MMLLNKVKYYRNKQGLSVEQLSKLSGLSTGAISYIENGRKIPSQISMILICKGLGLPVQRVFLLNYDTYKKYNSSP